MAGITFLLLKKPQTPDVLKIVSSLIAGVRRVEHEGLGRLMSMMKELLSIENVSIVGTDATGLE